MYKVDEHPDGCYMVAREGTFLAIAKVYAETDARMIADALNESAQLRAEAERLRGELKDIRATVGVAYAVLQSDYEPDPSECDTLLVHAALDMRAAALGKGATS